MQQRHLMDSIGKHDTFTANRTQQWKGLTFVPTYHASNYSTVKDGQNMRDPKFAKQRFLVSSIGEGAISGWESVIKGARDFQCFWGRALMVRSGHTMPFIMCQIAIALGYDDLYVTGVDYRPGPHIFDMHLPESKRFMDFLETPPLEGWQELRDAGSSYGIRISSTTPSSRLNDVLQYLPLERALDGS